MISIEVDHGKLKRLIKPTLGFRSMKTAFATIKGFEIMRMFKKRQFDIWTADQGLKGEIRLIERQFGVYFCSITHVFISKIKHNLVLENISFFAQHGSV